MENCIFCTREKDRIVLENTLAVAIKDGFPVTEGHSLIIPKRHVSSYFELTIEEKLACDQLLNSVRDLLVASDPTIEAFNIGINIGEAAGQSIFHCHIHLIPRRSGDTEHPRGGIRHVIPHKGCYPFS